MLWAYVRRHIHTWVCFNRHVTIEIGSLVVYVGCECGKCFWLHPNRNLQDAAAGAGLLLQTELEGARNARDDSVADPPGETPDGGRSGRE